MNPNPKSSHLKVAFTGTNCSGKTTMALDATARLKKAGVLAEVVSSQDRKITWKDDHFPVDYRAHYGMITNLIHAEVQAELKGDATIVVTDRSVLDLYAIATYDHPTCPQIADMEDMILAWCKSYTKIYYLAPLPYQEDGKRPANDFRMATHGQLRKLVERYQLRNLIELPREDIFKDIRSLVGLKSNPILGEDTKWEAIASYVGKPLMVKAPESVVSSDIDVWILSDVPYSYGDDARRLKESFTQYFGMPEGIVDVMLSPILATEQIRFEHKIYHPKS